MAAPYRPPLDDLALALEVVGRGAWAEALGGAAPDAESVGDLLAQLGRLAAEVIGPSDAVGDTQPAALDAATAAVTTPPAIHEAYARYVEGGWPALTHPTAIGGGGFPQLVGLAAEELLVTANLALSLNPMLTHGAVEALDHWGTEEQKARWLPKLVTGEWTGTMNLTEPDAGSDVGALRTRAVPRDDGTWAITGTKIFITWGEHDLADNIVHLVLARTPGSPEGTAGISLFVVPKVLDTRDGPVRNTVRCVGLEHKLGIHASPTCVMQYDEAVGELLGGERQGMAAMFTMMNAARLGVGLQGLAVGVRSFQQALAYAHERRQGRAPGAPAGVSSPIVEHPDVRRMLLAMASSVDAMRLVLLTTAAATDVAEHASGEARAAAEARVGLLTPIAKAWCTDEGVRLASLAVQVHGGMGYVEETGIAQRYRDARIAPIYEGTNGIQAIDLVLRKVARDGGAAMSAELDAAEAVAAGLPDTLADLAGPLRLGLSTLREATQWVAAKGSAAGGEAGRTDVLAGASAYLQLAGVVLGGTYLVDQAAHVAATGKPASVVEAKAALARFFLLEQVAPAVGLLGVVVAGSARLDVPGVLDAV